MPLFLFGFLGGVAGELLGLYDFQRRKPAEWPEYYKYPTYWLLSLAMAGFGSLLVVAYTGSDVDLNPLLALNIGASAPLILGTFVRTTPDLPPGSVD
jgi:hypothetical protein